MLTPLVVLLLGLAVGAGAVGVTVQGDDVGVVDEAVDGGDGDDVVAEGFAPERENARLDVTITEPLS